jgi:ADP-ribosylglycohydrolase
MGNGAAMRVAPLGAYWADDFGQLISEAENSARVTHSHAEGVIGTIAVAAAAAAAVKLKSEPANTRVKQFFETVLGHIPESRVRRGIVLAAQTPCDLEIDVVAKALGNGSLVTAPDTVPFCIWCAAHHLTDFVKAVAVAISAGGDCDTNAAIVGGIVALAVGRENIPAEWRKNREPLTFPELRVECQ